MPSQYDLKWERSFEALQEYHKQHGHLNVPFRNAPHQALAKWLNYQRHLRRKDKLRQDRFQKLESLGFSWYMETQEVQVAEDKRIQDTTTPAASIWEELRWEKKFEDLKKHAENTGSLLVNKKENQWLAKWASSQRRFYWEGELHQDRIDKLNEIGFPWKVKLGPPERPDLWEARLQELKERFKRTGSFRVYPKENETLSKWTAYQRRKYRKGEMRQDRIDKLNEIGFPWEVDVGRPNRYIWEEGPGDE